MNKSADVSMSLPGTTNEEGLNDKQSSDHGYHSNNNTESEGFRDGFSTNLDESDNEKQGSVNVNETTGSSKGFWDISPQMIFKVKIKTIYIRISMDKKRNNFHSDSDSNRQFVPYFSDEGNRNTNTDSSPVLGDYAPKPLLSSDGTVGYGGSEYIGSVYALDSCPKRLRYKWEYLWQEFCPELRSKLKMDEVAMFSVTDLRSADIMSNELLNVEGISPNSTITDATACVGGNTISFIRSFAKVNAVELDQTRVECLRDNLDVVQRFYSKENKNVDVPYIEFGVFEVFQGNCLEICPKLTQDIIFLDPPWGGVTYKNRGTVTLFLSGLSLGEVCKKLGNYAKFLALKLPMNTDIEEILSTSGGEFVSALPMGKMQFVILCYNRTLSTDQMKMLQSFGLLGMSN
eukprot:CAMPEP_0204863686 /NCGR_PEP_ID=MMETSP1348-20121228/3500_1 /ASSEMBLY_ACC=CAM_ASM_000700 /TAXON_ID=215587 /ORGANISM="Aplanochytrium stocchinoi, Strain GSBS06" /LENGTH=401 /DNA_ID=CAMNT_0052014085 /DNA_START=42 /DNA_END=1248 /DNA_ORIENTATION=+